MFTRVSLGNRLALASASLVIGITIIVGWTASHKIEAYARGLIGTSLAETAYQMADKLDRSMAARVTEVRLLQDALPVASHVDIDQIRHVLETLQESYEVASWIGFTNTTGQVIAATDRLLEGVDIGHRPVFVEGRQGLWVGDVHEAVMLAKLMPGPSGEDVKFVDIAAPVYLSDGRFAGTLAVHLSWEWAEQLKETMLSPHDQAQDVQILVAGGDGRVLLGPRSMLGTKLPLVTSERATESASWTIETWPDGEDYLTGRAASDGEGAFPGLGWTVLSRLPADEAFASVESMQRNIIIVGLVSALLAALLGWGMHLHMSAPLRRLARAAERVRQGGGASTIPLEPSSPELARLSQSMRSMVDQILNQREAIGELQDIAQADALTGLPNRSYLAEPLMKRLQAAHQLQRSVAFLFLDLDGFKQVNDTHGHHAGDLLLLEVARRLRDCLRGQDIAIRLGGDEFILILETEGARINWLAHTVGQRVLQAVSAPVTLPEGQHVCVGVSIGVAVWPDHGQSITNVMACADSALYAAKAAGKGRIQLYNREEVT